MADIEVSVSAGADDGDSGAFGFAATANAIVFGQGQNFWLRFLGIAIPQGSVIDACHIDLVGQQAASPGSPVTMTVFGNDVDDAAAPTSDADYNGKAVTTATVNWDAAWNAGTTYSSPELKTVIQEIVDRPGWSSGNDMLFLIKSRAPNSNFARARSFENLFGSPPGKIFIDWSAPAGGEFVGWGIIPI